MLSSPLLAHQQKAAISTVLFNPQTSNMEVSHRFYLHDAEHAVKRIFGKKADILASEKTRQQFADYVQERFAMYNQDDKQIALKAVGHEIDGKFLWIYQETAQPTNLQNLQIRHDALRDIWPSQTNTINVEGKGKLQTLTLEGNVKLAEIHFH